MDKDEKEGCGCAAMIIAAAIYLSFDKILDIVRLWIEKANP